MLWKLFLLFCVVFSTTVLSNTFEEFFEKNSFKQNILEQLPDGKSLYAKREEMLKRAGISIYIANFHMENHKSTRPLLEILCQKAKDGVDVRIVADSYASKKPFGKKARELNEKCGVRVIFYNELNWGLSNIAQALHTKLLVVDGREAIIGGSGYSDKNIYASIDDKKWYDLDIYLFGQSACYFHNQFVDLYVWSAKKKTDPKLLNPHLYSGENDIFLKRYGGKMRRCVGIPVGNSRVLPLVGNPMRLGKKRPLLKSYDLAIKSSKNKIWLYAPFFAPLKSFSNMLIAAAKRGVDVRVITNSAKSTDDGKGTTYSTFKGAKYLIQNGVRIFTWKKSSTLHRKGGIFDEKWAFFGSDNLDRRGQNYSAEVIAFTDDKREVKTLIENFEEDFKYTDEQDENSIQKELDKLGLSAKIKAYLFHRWY